MNRRKFLKLTGGGIILAAGVGVAGFLSTRTPNKALQPWKDAGNTYAEPRKKALSFAILAPNPHNRQPWKIDLSKPDIIRIFVDTDRVLPHTDPLNRQITIGFGCFLEVLRMAAAQDGYQVAANLFPEGVNEKLLDGRAIAELKFERDSGVKPDLLFEHVLDRRSLKEPYDLGRPLSDDLLNELSVLTMAKLRIGATSAVKQMEELRALTRQAMQIEIDTPHTYQESVDLFRIGKKEIEANPDGIDFAGPMFESLALVGVFSREVALDRNSSGYQQGIASIMESIDTAMGYVWLVSETNTRADQITAGRDWVRVNLAATRLGIGTQPLSQALQEYREMAEVYQNVHEKLAPKGGTIQMLARLGYGEKPAVSPRWALAEKLMYR